jgi:hypothetical protein
VIIGQPVLLPVLQAFSQSDRTPSGVGETGSSNPARRRSSTIVTIVIGCAFVADAVATSAGADRTDGHVPRHVPRRQLDDIRQWSCGALVDAAAREYFPYRCAVALADSLCPIIVESPGSHAGFVDHPSEFAERLRQVFGDEAAK